MAAKTQLDPVTFVGPTNREYGVGAITSVRTDGSIKYYFLHHPLSASSAGKPHKRYALFCRLTRKKYGEPVHSESIAKPSARQAANQLWADSKGVMDSLKDLVNKGPSS